MATAQDSTRIRVDQLDYQSFPFLVQIPSAARIRY